MIDKMKEVDHTHPHGDESVARVFKRGRAVAADGSGRRGRTEEQRETAEDEQTADGESMNDVDHEPPNGEGANPAFERGRKRQADVSGNIDEDTE